jgi:hypothetical protein
MQGSGAVLFYFTNNTMHTASPLQREPLNIVSVYTHTSIIAEGYSLLGYDALYGSTSNSAASVI